MTWHKDLTDHEIRICKMVIDGWTYQGVAKRLNIPLAEVERALDKYRMLMPPNV